VIQVVTLEALCDLWFLKTCPIIHLAAHLPAEGDLLLRRENLIADDEPSACRPSLLRLAKKVVAHGLAQGGADDFRPDMRRHRLDDVAYGPGLPYSALMPTVRISLP